MMPTYNDLANVRMPTMAEALMRAREKRAAKAAKEAGGMETAAREKARGMLRGQGLFPDVERVTQDLRNYEPGMGGGQAMPAGRVEEVDMQTSPLVVGGNDLDVSPVTVDTRPQMQLPPQQAQLPPQAQPVAQQAPQGDPRRQRILAMLQDGTIDPEIARQLLTRGS